MNVISRSLASGNTSSPCAVTVNLCACSGPHKLPAPAATRKPEVEKPKKMTVKSLAAERLKLLAKIKQYSESCPSTIKWPACRHRLVTQIKKCTLSNLCLQKRSWNACPVAWKVLFGVRSCHYDLATIPTHAQHIACSQSTHGHRRDTTMTTV